jgi:hypothetical protein
LSTTFRLVAATRVGWHQGFTGREVPRKRKRKKTSYGQHGAVTWRRYELDHGCVARKTKKTTVITMLQQVHNQYQTNVATRTGETKTTNASKKEEG